MADHCEGGGFLGMKGLLVIDVIELEARKQKKNI